mmetsp:Transcript_31591/g.60320  ORF Transcript_31591/g.60320 Transcript_31591/m.60320 type:complete len:257 (+) Transcript_31591:104-874(+)
MMAMLLPLLITLNAVSSNHALAPPSSSAFLVKSLTNTKEWTPTSLMMMPPRIVGATPTPLLFGADSGRRANGSRKNNHRHRDCITNNNFLMMVRGGGGGEDADDTTTTDDDDDDDDDPSKDEDTSCSICLINRQGPCRKYWLKFERCMKEHGAEKEKDQRQQQRAAAEEDDEDDKKESTAEEEAGSEGDEDGEDEDREEGKEADDGEEGGEKVSMEEEWDAFMLKTIRPGEDDDDDDDDPRLFLGNLGGRGPLLQW